MQDQRTPGDRTNTQRACRALRAVAGGRYTEDAGLGIGPVGSAIRAGRWQGVPDDQDAFHQAIKDALCDLRHLCDRVGVDFDAADRAAYDVYASEKGEDPAGEWPFWSEAFQ